MGITTPLRAALRKTFYPYVESQGFVLDKSQQPDTAVFRGRRQDVIHVFEITWDRYGAPRFSLTFGETPASGAMLDGKHVGGEEVRVCCSASMLALQRKRTGLKAGWFQLRRPFVQQLLTRKRDYSPQEVVAQLMAWFPEVDAWWDSKAIGPHLWSIREAACGWSATSVAPTGPLQP